MNEDCARGPNPTGTVWEPKKKSQHGYSVASRSKRYDPIYDLDFEGEGFSSDSENQVYIGEIGEYEEEMALELEKKNSNREVPTAVKENLAVHEDENSKCKGK
ncbi:hypothetical protein TorRG33x02_109490 [Trema orientale]|uniref:Uncharacterized protein n=1 Tax=Trema orientale TaxID=63057 RepID=A0A2P5F6F4_TREOI|nr:hypothetical protein TorRG33x02_109490 [Trema orientale]